jgi:hypothetical protein
MRFVTISGRSGSTVASTTQSTDGYGRRHLMSLQRSSPERPSQREVAARDRATIWAAWSLWAVFWVLLVISVVLSIPANTTAYSLAFGAVLSAFATVGAVVIARQPRNAVGWLSLAVGLLGSWNAVAANYAEVALVVRPGSLPGGLAMGWQTRPLGYIWGLTFTFLPLLFPTGRLPTRRWRPFAWITAIILVSSSVVYALMPGPLRLDLAGAEEQGWPRNPLGIERAAATLQRMEQLLVLCTVAVAVLCAASLLVRFRRAQGVERQQLKWFTYAIALFALLFTAYALSTVVWGEWVPATASDVVFVIGYGLIPIGAGIAILLYRLYDIDRIINRTLVYGLLTAILGVIYVGTILLLGQLFGGVTDDPPNWVIAGATLAVAALFQPARRRVQRVVDRRFNRARYDAARTIEAFSVRLRDQVDLDTLTTELLAVVDHTIEPTTASLWLRPQATPNSHASRGTIPGLQSTRTGQHFK